ncbi:hypothetical protein ABPG72_020897 [Tetrahymena utriculariae]
MGNNQNKSSASQINKNLSVKEFMSSNLFKNKDYSAILRRDFVQDQSNENLSQEDSNLDNYTIKIQMTNEAVSQLGIGFAWITNLEILEIYLSYNKVQDEGANSLFNGIEQCQNLECIFLELRKNLISSKGALGLAQGLSNCTNLKILYLDLMDNQIADQGASNLIILLSKCKNLSNVNISLENNKIVNIGEQIGSALQWCSNLIVLTLNLRSNQIGTKGLSNLGESLRNCLKLKSLNLDLQ